MWWNWKREKKRFCGDCWGFPLLKLGLEKGRAEKLEEEEDEWGQRSGNSVEFLYHRW